MARVCSDNVLTFSSDTLQGQFLDRDDNNNLCLEESTVSCEEQDKIKTEIVLSKIYKLPGYDNVNYNTLVKIHKKNILGSMHGNYVFMSQNVVECFYPKQLQLVGL